MTWYYALGNERQGPIDDAALDRLVAAGTVTPDTLVWKAGMADWQPLSQARPRIAPPPAPIIPPPPAAIIPTPVVPGPDTQPRPATPSPSFTPAPIPTPGPGSFGAGAADAGGWSQAASGGAETADEIFARVSASGRTLAIGEIVGRAWQLVMANVGLAVGGGAILLLCNVAGAIPCLGILISLGVTPIVTGGLYRLLLKLHRGQPAEFGDVFSTFSTSYLPLLLYAVVQAILIAVSLVPGYVLVFLGNILGQRSEALGMLLLLLGFLLMLPPAIYLAVSWVFAAPLIVDKGLDFWPAMELSRKVAAKQFFSVFGLLVLCGLIVFAGIVALCLGIFVALPVALAAIAIAYDDLFRRA